MSTGASKPSRPPAYDGRGSPPARTTVGAALGKALGNAVRSTDLGAGFEWEGRGGPGAQGNPGGGSPADPSRAQRGGPRGPGRWSGRGPGRGGGSLYLLLAGVALAVVLVALAFWAYAIRDDFGGTSAFRDSVFSGARPEISLENGSGRVRVEGVGGVEEVRLSATRYARGRSPEAAAQNAADIPVEVTSKGSEVSVSTGRGGGVDYELEVPAGSTVSVRSGSGDVEVSGVSGSVEARAKAGEVAVRDARGPVRVEVGSGDVSVGRVNTDTGRVELSVESGDLELSDLVVGSLVAEAETGTATLSGRFSGGGSVSVGTGDVVVGVPREDVRNLQLEARVGEVRRADGGTGAGEGR